MFVTLLYAHDVVTTTTTTIVGSQLKSLIAGVTKLHTRDCNAKGHFDPASCAFLQQGS